MADLRFGLTPADRTLLENRAVLAVDQDRTVADRVLDAIARLARMIRSARIVFGIDGLGTGTYFRTVPRPWPRT